MVSKMTVLALLTLISCTMAGDKNSHDQIRKQMDSKKIQDPLQRDLDDMNEQVIGVIVIFYIIAFCVVAGINIFLCLKCLRKRAVSNGIKEQIQMKRMEFATMNGIDFRTLNDPRYSQTIHA